MELTKVPLSELLEVIAPSRCNKEKHLRCNKLNLFDLRIPFEYAIYICRQFPVYYSILKHYYKGVIMTVYIYQKTCSNSLSYFPYTESGFSSYYHAYKYLEVLKKPYNASCIVVSKLNINQAISKYCK